MTGYVALERVDRISVRALAWQGSIRAGDVLGADGRPRPMVGPVDDRPLVERIGERWAIVREQWAITTFFLFDPESWR